MDYYQILELEKKASEKDIKSAYKKLAIKYHPDKNKNDGEKFKKISEAYQVLSNKEKREKYDHGFHIEHSSFHSPNELFKDFFKDIPWEYIDLANSFLLQFLESPECELTFKIIDNLPQKHKIIKVLEFILQDLTDEYTKEVIQKYLNKLKVEKPNNTRHNQYIQESEDIFNLSLSIQKIKRNKVSMDTLQQSPYDIEFNINCSLEDIYNKVEKTIHIQRISYDVVHEEDKFYFQENKRLQFKSHFRPILTFKQEGNQLPNKDVRGDIILNINHKKHPYFDIIHDYDLLYVKKISIYELYYGTQFNIPYFNNRILSLRTNHTIRHHLMQKIDNLGLPIPQTDNYGVLYIQFEIEYNDIDLSTNSQVIFELFPPIQENKDTDENTEQYLLSNTEEHIHK